jgi:DNA-binding NarL/FixJ family response regulator
MKILDISAEQLVSIAVKSIIQKHFKQAEVLSSNDHDEITALLETHTFDVILLDIGINTMNTFALMKTLTTIQQDAKVLVFSREEYKPYVLQYIAQGASGFLDKSSSEEELLLAVNLVKSGQLYLSKDLLMSVYNENINQDDNPTPFNKLSKRELEVFKLLIKGKRVKDISKIMKIHQSTTSTLKKRILQKFKVDNIIKLKTMAMEYGY